MNPSQPPIEEWLRRPQRYWYVDGLSEMAVGGVFLLVALSSLEAWLVPPGAVQNWILAILQPLVVIGGVLGARVLVRYLKERITYPRTGRVDYPKPSPARRWLMRALVGLIAFGIAFLVVHIGKSAGERWLPMVSAFFIAFVTALGWRLHLMRMIWLAFYILGVGVVLTMWPLASPLDALAFFGLVGVGWLISGGVTLLCYLRQTRSMDEAEGS